MHRSFPGTDERSWGEYQLAINRMGRAPLGAFQSTPSGIAAAESGFTSTKAHLNHLRARFAQRFHASQGGPGTRGDPWLGGSVLTTQLRAAAAIGLDGTAETLEWSETRYFPGRIIVEERAAAFQAASEWNRRDTVWTEGPRQDSGRAGAARD